MLPEPPEVPLVAAAVAVAAVTVFEVDTSVIVLIEMESEVVAFVLGDRDEAEEVVLGMVCEEVEVGR